MGFQGSKVWRFVQIIKGSKVKEASLIVIRDTLGQSARIHVIQAFNKREVSRAESLPITMCPTNNFIVIKHSQNSQTL